MSSRPAESRTTERGIVIRATAIVRTNSIPSSAPSAASGVPATCDALRDAEHMALLRELEKTHWNISRTARALGISRNTLYRKIHRHRIKLSAVDLGR